MSNLTQRILTAVVAIPVIVFLCIAGGWYFFLFVSAASGVALHEFYSLASAKGASPMVRLGIVSGFFVGCSFFNAQLQTMFAFVFSIRLEYPSQPQFLLITIMVSIIVLSMTELFRNKGSALLNISTTLFGILYVSLFFSSFIGIREIFTPLDFPMLRYFAAVGAAETAKVYRWGGYTVISIFAMIWICDTAAFHFGKAMGKHKLFPRVSPNKTWEGGIAGFIAAILTSVAAKYLVLEYLPIGSAIVIGIIVGVFGQLGDLFESLLKRDAGVKDSSQLIPGHGGAFDRFDSLLLVAPIVYLYLDFILFG
ncbi:MAG TPA: phosphatidate cytidylyltransferase [Bacteroidota bacterium]|nr:phosphatidate cytidylyltransferase [Bacteroidota bacterium]